MPTISPAAKGWIWNLPSVASATNSRERLGGAVERVERFREGRGQAPADLRRGLGDGGHRDRGRGGSDAGGLQELATLHWRSPVVFGGRHIRHVPAAIKLVFRMTEAGRGFRSGSGDRTAPPRGCGLNRRPFEGARSGVRSDNSERFGPCRSDCMVLANKISRSAPTDMAGRWATLTRVMLSRARLSLICCSLSKSRWAVPSSRNSTRGCRRGRAPGARVASGRRRASCPCRRRGCCTSSAWP